VALADFILQGLPEKFSYTNPETGRKGWQIQDSPAINAQ
jgi:hypothetical protein